MRTIIRVEHPSDGNGMWRHKGNGYWTVPETVSIRHNRFLNRREELEQLRSNI